MGGHGSLVQNLRIPYYAASTREVATSILDLLGPVDGCAARNAGEFTSSGHRPSRVDIRWHGSREGRGRGPARRPVCQAVWRQGNRAGSHIHCETCRSASSTVESQARRHDRTVAIRRPVSANSQDELRGSQRRGFQVLRDAPAPKTRPEPHGILSNLHVQ